MPAAVQHCEDCDRVRFDTEEDSERKAADLRPANVIDPRRIEIGIAANAIPAGFDLDEELQSKSAPLEFVPKELGLQLELRAPADA
jgi:hypothetical protein